MKTIFKSIVSISLALLVTSGFAQSKKVATKSVAKTSTSTIKSQTTTKTTTQKTVEPIAKKEVEAPKQESKTSFIPTSSESPLSKLSSIGKKDKAPTSTGSIPQSSFRKGSKYLGGNINFGSSTSTSFALFGEYGVTDYLSVGGSVSMASSSVARSMYVGGDVTLHMSNLIHSGSIDPYIGVSGGYNTFKDKNLTEDRDRSRDPNNGLKLIGNAGINYYLTPRTIAFVSASIGIVNGSPLQYGGGLKLGF